MNINIEDDSLSPQRNIRDMFPVFEQLRYSQTLSNTTMLILPLLFNCAIRNELEIWNLDIFLCQLHDVVYISKETVNT